MPALFPGASAEQISAIQRATADILANTGLRVAHAGLRARCRSAGAIVDEGTEVVRFPADLLAELLLQVPSEYTVRGVAGDRWAIGGEHQHCLAIVTDPWIVDYETQRPRRPCLDDLRRHTIIAAQLPDVFAVSCMDYPVTDVPGRHSSLRALIEHLCHHHKHIYVLAATEESFRRWLEIGEILLQGAPLAGSSLFTIGVAVISPLTLSTLNANLMRQACAYGFPIVPTVCPQAGTTAPYSLAGALLQANVEVIALAALTQIIHPGNPFLYAIGPSVADMRSGHDRYYTLDKVLWKHAGVQLGKSYGMPVAAECGGSMTFRCDAQAGAEGMLFMLAAQASGANVLAGIGSCYNAVGMSAEMMVIQTAWLQASGFLARGLLFTHLDEAIAAIQRQGPGGNFLADDSTLTRLRSGEFFSSDLFDYSGYVEEGPSLLQRAHERAEKLVSSYEPRVPQQVRDSLVAWLMGATAA